jgi:Flp pilus assembly pilin Flp
MLIKKLPLGLMEKLWRFIRDEKGLETVEWTMLAALIILGVVLVIESLRTEMGNIFQGLATEMQQGQ